MTLTTYEAADFPSAHYLTKVVKMGMNVEPRIRLRPHEVPIRVVFDTVAETATLVVETYEFRDLSRRTVYTKSGVRAISWNIDNPVQIASMTSWDDEPVSRPDEVNFGRIWTAEEKREQREWEANTYRVGSPSNPMDNAARCAEGHTTEAMLAHWR